MNYAVEIRKVVRQRVARATTSVPGSTWGPAYGPLLGEVLSYLASIQVGPVGPPFARFEVHANHVVVEAGVPVSVDIVSHRGVSAGELPGGRAAITTHMGPYNSLGGAHEAVLAWIADQGAQPAGPSWEVYFTDPRLEPDERQWKTEVVYLVA